MSLKLSDDLLKEQKKHLDFLESWSETFPKVVGVDIVRCLTYELIQVLNQRYLRHDDPNVEQS